VQEFLTSTTKWTLVVRSVSRPGHFTLAERNPLNRRLGGWGGGGVAEPISSCGKNINLLSLTEIELGASVVWPILLTMPTELLRHHHNNNSTHWIHVQLFPVKCCLFTTERSETTYWILILNKWAVNVKASLLLHALKGTYKYIDKAVPVTGCGGP
jgi:hypothetical protein